MQRIVVRITWVFVVLILLGAAPPPAEAGVGGSPIGSYRGFFQSTATPGLWGLVDFAITDVHNRRWTGMVTMIIPVGASQVQLPFAVVGTIAADVNVAQEAGTFDHELGHDLGLGHGSATFNGVGHGVADDSFVEIHGRIDFLDGGAALTDARYRFRPPQTPGTDPLPTDEGTSTLLRGFTFEPNMPPPNVSGDWNGTYMSDALGGNGTFALSIRQSCEVQTNTDSLPIFEPNFGGLEIIDGNKDNPFYFLGSISGNNLFAVEGWNLMGDRFLVTGNMTPPDGTTPAMATAKYLLLFANGTTDRGSLNFAQPGVPPPCRPIVDQP
jgi:hypothetical protein